MVVENIAEDMERFDRIVIQTNIHSVIVACIFAFYFFVLTCRF